MITRIMDVILRHLLQIIQGVCSLWLGSRLNPVLILGQKKLWGYSVAILEHETIRNTGDPFT